MIKELLEKAGISLTMSSNQILEECSDFTVTLVYVYVDGKAYRYVYDNQEDDYFYEQACRQYVKENGLDVDWIKDMVNFPQMEYYVTDMNANVVYGERLRVEDQTGEEAISCDLGYSGTIDMLTLDMDNFQGVPNELFKIITWLYTEGVRLRGINFD